MRRWDKSEVNRSRSMLGTWLYRARHRSARIWYLFVYHTFLSSLSPSIQQNLRSTMPAVVALPVSFASQLFFPFNNKPPSNRAVRLKESFCPRADRGGSEDTPEESKGDKQEVDWDKAWSRYKEEKKRKPFLSMFDDVEKYVTRSPFKSEYPLTEEIDPLKRTERRTLDFWTDSKFTIAGFGVILGLFIYMVVIVGAPPPK